MSTNSKGRKKMPEEECVRLAFNVTKEMNEHIEEYMRKVGIENKSDALRVLIKAQLNPEYE